ncbi:metallophosphoesterase family protein [Rhizobium wuzhouense]|uniref:Metallophosphoesterase n=1 Tax=Rhizobium wuzhouense TaxID=1986026 RepID=A0ABX5NQH2_9HYPH|nr:metallophosphoesterase [Rhizobium wuzhouense]PYB71776.1 metallophosphoesterase [Rhizobium wuzhouense]
MRHRDLPAIAIIADAHYHDLEGDYGFEGVDVNGKRLAVRSWAETRASTRVFNESFRALPAALDEIVDRGIRHVVLLGDYTDDGQRQTTDAVWRLLEEYRRAHRLSFYVIPGNHDVFGPHGRHQSKGFLSGSGSAVTVTSDEQVADSRPNARLSKRMYCEGYPVGLLPMRAFGLFAQPVYHHWESPFGLSDSIQDRQYLVSSADGRSTFSLMDASYLVEPEEGLWLLMIDANVFEPRNGHHDPFREETFIDSTAAGWNALLRLKPFLIDWIKNVHERAKILGKTVLSFSHYPVIDPFDDTNGSEAALFGNTNMAKRTPSKVVADTLLDTGMTVHFSGHLHVEGTTRRSQEGRELVNIAVPSLVAFPPAFKIVQPGKNLPDVKTVGLSPLPLDPALIKLYRLECASNGEMPDPAFDTQSYGAFLFAHTRALVTHRYFPREWPPKIVEGVAKVNLAEIGLVMLAAGSTDEVTTPHSAIPCRKMALLEQECTRFCLSIEALSSNSMIDLVTDWYCLRQAGALALPFISVERLAIYRLLTGRLLDQSPPAPPQTAGAFLQVFLHCLRRWLKRAGVEPHEGALLPSASL